MIITKYKDNFYDSLGNIINLEVGDILQVRMLEDNTFLLFKNSKSAEPVVETVVNEDFEELLNKECKKEKIIKKKLLRVNKMKYRIIKKQAFRRDYYNIQYRRFGVWVTFKEGEKENWPVNFNTIDEAKGWIKEDIEERKRNTCAEKSCVVEEIEYPERTV